MFRASALVAVSLALVQLGCARLPDAEIFNATLYDFYTKGPEIGSFEPGSIFLVHPLSDSWTVEDLRALEGSVSNSNCHFNAEIYERIAARNTTPSKLSSQIAPRAHWRVATNREIAATQDGYPPHKLGDDFVWSVGSFSLPAYSDDGNTAYMLLTFSWGLHGGYGEYTLVKDRGGWLVQCREFLHVA